MICSREYEYKTTIITSRHLQKQHCASSRGPSYEAPSFLTTMPSAIVSGDCSSGGYCVSAQNCVSNPTVNATVVQGGVPSRTAPTNSILCYSNFVFADWEGLATLEPRPILTCWNGVFEFTCPEGSILWAAGYEAVAVRGFKSNERVSGRCGSGTNIVYAFQEDPTCPGKQFSHDNRISNAGTLLACSDPCAACGTPTFSNEYAEDRQVCRDVSASPSASASPSIAPISSAAAPPSGVPILEYGYILAMLAWMLRGY